MAKVAINSLASNNGSTPTVQAEPLTALAEPNYWKIMLVDDDAHNHRMIKLFLKNFEFEGKPLQIHSVYSGAEAIEQIQQHPDTALILLDMVMEELDSGLKVAQFVRHQANNRLVRIVMLTGQSCITTEQEIVTRYDINDYKVKTDFSRQKLTTTVMASLRSYRDLVTLETHRKKLADLSAGLSAQAAELERANRELEQKNARLQAEIREHANTGRALQESEERYRTLIENSPDVFFRFDSACRHTYVSRNVVKIFGREAAEYLGKTHAQSGFSAAEAQAWAAKIQQVLDTAKPFEEEIFYHGANGRRTLNLRLIPEFGPAETVVSVLGIVSDITDRKQMEAELESLLDAEHEQRLLAETLSEATLAFSSQMSQADVLNEILRQMGRLVAYRHAHIMLLKNNVLKIACWHGYNEAEASARIAGLVQNLDDFPMDARVIRTREPVVIEDTHNTPGWVVQPETAWVKSHLTVPICLSDTVLGLLRMDSQVTGAFTANDVQRLQPLARAAAIALQNANLYDQAQQEIAERRQAEEALTESAARYHTLFEESPISLWEEDFSQVKAYLDELNAGGVDDFADYFNRHPEAVTRCAELIKILDVNRATLELFGAASKKELLQGLPRIFTDESFRVFKQEILALIQGATEYSNENVHQTLHGDVIAVTVHLSIAPGYEQSWKKVFVSVVDVTALKKSQEIFRRYEFIVNASQELMTLIDSNYKYMAASDAYCRAHNKPRNKIVGKTVAQLWGKVRFEGRLKHVLDRCFAGERIQYERWIEFAKLGKRCVEVTCYPYQSSSQGRVTHVVVVSRDITAYRQAEAALRQAHAKTERLLSSIPLALIGIDGQNVITHWNEPAEVAFDVPRSAAVGQRLNNGLVAWNWQKIEPGLAACRDKGHAIDMPDVRYTRSDGKEAFLKITATPFVTETSGAGGVLLLVQD
ncbi:MAG: PAS domain S-box protein, partial [Chloroflexi bacterium]